MASYLVTQATGQQGQSVIKHLLAAGVEVHAVVRDLEKVPALLKSPGVTLFKGESKNFEEIYQAAQGCKGAYLNTLPIPGFEAHQAQTIAEASKKAGVEILVAATTLCTNKKALWDDQASEECQMRGYFASKTQVEDIVRGAGFKAYTILRPSILHQDYLMPGAYQNYPRLPTHGELDHAFNEGVKAPYTDADDVGKYAAAALQNPDKFGGQEIDLGNELLTVEEAGDILVKVSGKDVPVRKRTPEEIEAIKDTVFGQRVQLWANLYDFSAYANTAKEVQAKFGIPFTPLEASLQRDKARLLECLSASA
ncbi:NmrA family protein [Hypoxylon rubiginosum]|uniref:NmrA family protein n=1 Tax=Hypoxylon rubiginosum TaxID=110542 RepID=A0ACC0CQ25_9PEZI|nr:NmrA family protein [Hypoxylon rubiginosum]